MLPSKIEIQRLIMANEFSDNLQRASVFIGAQFASQMYSQTIYAQYKYILCSIHQVTKGSFKVEESLTE
ncbi:hypothetical protein V1478_017760 [Vespula squamosa]|uniref:Uncharacterized protein n=1 Tax=Vespula squamosa TaxID=30214 RepID=A0ABD1ZZA6_VESSQ